MHENDIARIVVDAVFNVHKNLGPGLFESVYEEALAYELSKRNLKFTCQKGINVQYEDVTLNVAFRADIIVEGKVILELKSVEELAKVHYKQNIPNLV